MTQEQFFRLPGYLMPHIITIEQLQDKSDRTLLYGYTCDRKTHHVYIKQGKIHIYQYSLSSGESPCEKILRCNQDYLPDKRLYPECCDFEFSGLLQHAGIHLPFTTFDSSRKESIYYGIIFDDETGEI